MKTKTVLEKDISQNSNAPTNGAEIVVHFLLHKGIETVVGIPGGANLPLYDALHGSGIRHILARNEQGAGFIAQGIARATGAVAVCLASSGPGATNLVTAIADAKCDSVPLVAITGQVSTSLIGTDAFQEIDTYGLSKPITKRNYIVRSVQELISALSEAFQIAEEGRPGPVWIDIPKDVQLSPYEGDWEKTLEEWDLLETSGKITFVDPFFEEKFVSFCELLRDCKRPVLYIGGGVKLAAAEYLLRDFAESQDIPVTSTLMGLDCFPQNHRLSLGMLGMHGAPFTNLVLEESDLLLAFGVRFDDRATGKLETFCPNAKVVHVDIDPREIGKLRKPDLSFQTDLYDFLKNAVGIPSRRRGEWNSLVSSWKALFPLPNLRTNGGFSPDVILKICKESLGSDAILTSDVGQHQMWVAQFYPFQNRRTWVTSGGLGTMGFGLPVAIGISLAMPKKTVLCISGDGSILMNIQELDTLADLQSNVKILIFDNRHLGLVRQQQELFFQSRFYGSSYERESKLAAVAQAFDIPSLNLAEVANPIDELRKFLVKPGPGFAVIPVDPTLHVLPMVPAGKGNLEMLLE
ncbi:acetolactate synthase, large subunit, biosynthetic type [Leptospira fainei serovar Hurstbridge str. BUT 6]|uniref:Acetolactate synthase n=1 Tax=Leptospira fainei serovar Hurstbridge str. BUT 6 TaxID=1193011 RepID=S3VB87_9LEPT|nr:biosynthetic-type acetolactate synthase large subunit [Leptospira fainei]EPG73735.1 acetolactate synthase, large subunit, biosynthetic type [Leptospira fainei serovar Hurstbridge str. BUT 6]